MRIILILSFLWSSIAIAQTIPSCNNGDAQTTINANGDISCVTPSGDSYTMDSSVTAQAKIVSQSALQQQINASAAQQALNNQAMAKVISNAIQSDPTLSAQQQAITASTTQINGVKGS